MTLAPRSKVAVAICVAGVIATAMAGCSAPNAGGADSSGPRVNPGVAIVRSHMTATQREALAPVNPTKTKYAINRDLSAGQVDTRLSRFQRSGAWSGLDIYHTMHDGADCYYSNGTFTVMK